MPHDTPHSWSTKGSSGNRRVTPPNSNDFASGYIDIANWPDVVRDVAADRPVDAGADGHPAVERDCVPELLALRPDRVVVVEAVEPERVEPLRLALEEERVAVRAGRAR